MNSPKFLADWAPISRGYIIVGGCFPWCMIYSSSRSRDQLASASMRAGRDRTIKCQAGFMMRFGTPHHGEDTLRRERVCTEAVRRPGGQFGTLTTDSNLEVLQLDCSRGPGWRAYRLSKRINVKLVSLTRAGDTLLSIGGSALTTTISIEKLWRLASLATWLDSGNKV